MEETQNIIALAGNPNVGKSTIFNGLTKLHQHTGNNELVVNKHKHRRNSPYDTSGEPCLL